MPPSGRPLDADDVGLPVSDLIAAIKHAIKLANVSAVILAGTWQ